MRKVVSWLCMFLMAFAMFSRFMIIVKAFSHDYWVSTSGNDGNSGTSSGSAWRHIPFAIAHADLSAAATIHVIAGTYTDLTGCSGYSALICMNRNGASSSQLFRIQCETPYTVPSGGGCLLRTSTGGVAGIDFAANNIEVVGFDYTNPNSEVGVTFRCNNPGSMTSGQCPSGNNAHLYLSYIHDVSQNVFDGTSGMTGCPAFGMVDTNGGVRHGLNIYQVGIQIVGNRLYNYGNQALSFRNGGRCNEAQGVYFGQNGMVAMNIIIGITSYGIQGYSQPCNLAIIGNVVDQSGRGDIVVGGGDCPGGIITINNNILTAMAGQGGILLGASGVAPCSSGRRITISNNLFGAGRPQVVGSLNGCTDVSGSLSEQPSTTFKSYQLPSGNNNYSLNTNSVANGSGVSGKCAAGQTYSCTPPIDASGNSLTNPPSRGAYQSGGSPPTPPSPTGLLTPTSITFVDTFNGFTSSFQPITVNNTSGVAVVFTSIAPSSHFNTVTSATPCPIGGGGLAPGASCEVDVTFSPNAVGPFTGTITFTDNFVGTPASPQTVALSGNGVTPQAPAAPTGVTVVTH